MDKEKLVHKPHVGPDPVKAKPNHVREKNYKAPDTPERLEKEEQALPEKTAEAKVDTEMSEAVDKVRQRL